MWEAGDSIRRQIMVPGAIVARGKFAPLDTIFWKLFSFLKKKHREFVPLDSILSWAKCWQWPADSPFDLISRGR